VIFLAGLTILKKERCLGIVGGWGVDPVVALCLRNASEYRLPTIRPHGIKLGHSWYQWIIKVIFLAGFTISKKVRCLGRLSGSGVDPVVALHLMNAADYRLPTFEPHGTKLGHSRYQWIIKVIFMAGLTIIKNVRCLGRLSGRGADPVVALHLKNAADNHLPTFGPHGNKLGHSWYHWIIKNDFSCWFDNSKKGEVSGQIEWIGGWSCGCTPPKECCRLPTTYFWTTWHQTRAFLILVNNKSDFLAGLAILKKVRCLGRLSGWKVDPVVAPQPRSAGDYRLPTFGPHGTKLGHSWYQWKIKVIFLAGLTILKKERCLSRLSGWGVDHVVARRLRNAAEYRIPIFGPHGTKLGHSWYQWRIDSDFSGWFDNSEKGDVFGQIEWMGGWSRGCTPPKEYCRLPPTYFWTTWHQTRAFLISVINKKWFFWLVWQFWKRWVVCPDWVDRGLIPWLHAASGMLQSTANLLLDHMAPN